jgi:hypothetical protein
MLAVARRLILIAAMLLTGPALATADEPVAAADAGAIRQVIQGQMDAFRSDDWAAAFPNLQPDGDPGLPAGLSAA